jgi:hypothetical protein
MQTLSKAIKNHSWIAFGIKLSLFLVIALIFYFQIKSVKWNFKGLEEFRIISIIIAVFLMPLNWFCEYKKWTFTVNSIVKESEKSDIQNSFLAGIVSGMLTPNMLGNFVGRIFYFKRQYRVDLIILTTLSNFSQFLWSIIFGLIGIAVVNIETQMYIIWICLPIVIFLIAFFFLFDRFLMFIPYSKKWIKRFTEYDFSKSLQLQFLLWSGLRHLIFSIQFSLVLNFFNEEISINLLLWIWQVYFWVTLSPSLFLGKIVIRESVAVWVLAAAGLDPTIVILSSLSIWVMNLFIPTILSLFFCKAPQVSTV